MPREPYPFGAKRELKISYKDRILNKSYVADLIVFEKIIVEVKALTNLTSREEAQLLNYLKATGHKVGVLINFGSDRKLDWKRMVFTKLSTNNANHRE